MSPFLRDGRGCQCTRGFFTLRPCAAEAPHTCPQCQRRICGEHWYAGGPVPCCVECAARADEARHAYDDDLWFHSYRHRYYTSSGYRPAYTGYVTADIGTYYDPYDVRGFDAPASGAGSTDFDDDGAGGLGDS